MIMKSHAKGQFFGLEFGIHCLQIKGLARNFWRGGTYFKWFSAISLAPVGGVEGHMSSIAPLNTNGGPD